MDGLGMGGDGMAAEILREDEMLIVFLLYEALVSGHRGRWRAYICSLPQSADLPVLWESWRSDELPGADRDTVADLRKEMIVGYENAKQALLDRKPDVFPPHLFTWEAWQVCYPTQSHCNKNSSSNSYAWCSLLLQLAISTIVVG